MMNNTFKLAIVILLFCAISSEAETIKRGGGSDYISYIRGKEAIIYWQIASFESPVDIILWNRDNQKYDTLAKKVKNEGKYFWNIPETYPLGEHYKLIICESNNKNNFLISYNYVSIESFDKEPKDPSLYLNTLVYPNPANDYLYITNYKLVFGKIEIYDSIGKLYISMYPKPQIDIRDFPCGTYYFKINGRTEKIVKE